MSMWLVRHGRNKPVGPLSTRMMVDGIAKGTVPVDSEATRVGTDEWRPLHAYKEFAEALPFDDAVTRVSDAPWFLAGKQPHAPDPVPIAPTVALVPLPAAPVAKAQALAPAPAHAPPPIPARAKEPAPANAQKEAAHAQEHHAGFDDDDEETRVAPIRSDRAGARPAAGMPAPRPAAGVPAPKRASGAPAAGTTQNMASVNERDTARPGPAASPPMAAPNPLAQMPRLPPAAPVPSASPQRSASRATAQAVYGEVDDQALTKVASAAPERAERAPEPPPFDTRRAKTMPAIHSNRPPPDAAQSVRSTQEAAVVVQESQLPAAHAGGLNLGPGRPKRPKFERGLVPSTGVPVSRSRVQLDATSKTLIGVIVALLVALTLVVVLLAARS